jgi:pimeloyl-ACP methyl ester carboxylesterase
MARKVPIINGYAPNGLPYSRIGNGPRVLAVFDGLDFSHRPPSAMDTRVSMGFARPMADEYTVYRVRRRPGLPHGYSLADMAADYAVMINDMFGGPVDVMGLSTGGSIALHFALDHPGLTRSLVLACAGCRLIPSGKKLQLDVAEAAGRGKWRRAAALMAPALAKGLVSRLLSLFFWLMGKNFYSPSCETDGIVEIEAEDLHDVTDRLHEISVPVLVIGGDEDYFYPVAETAAGIPGASLVLYPRTGHTAIMKKDFSARLLEFLNSV